MKTKLGLAIIFVIASFHYGYGQNTKQDSFNRSIGIDANFINNFLPFENPIGSRGPYLIHFIKYRNNNRFFRHGFDMSIGGLFTNSESSTDDDNLYFLSTSYKFSEGKRKSIFKRGYLLFGGEWGVNYFHRTSVTKRPSSFGQQVRKDKVDQASFTIGPFIGLEYKLSKRISVYTEGAYYLSFQYATERFKSEPNSSSNTLDSSISFGDVKRFPRSIILFYSF